MLRGQECNFAVGSLDRARLAVAAEVVVVVVVVVVRVGVDVAGVVPGRLAAEAESETGVGSSNTCSSLCCYHQASSVRDRYCQTPY